MVCSHGPFTVMSSSPGTEDSATLMHFSGIWNRPRKSTKSLLIKRRLRKYCNSSSVKRNWHKSWISRSEEHTSELQSLMRSPSAVFCLKKKTKEQTYKQQPLIRKSYYA